AHARKAGTGKLPRRALSQDALRRAGIPGGPTDRARLAKRDWQPRPYARGEIGVGQRAFTPNSDKSMASAIALYPASLGCRLSRILKPGRNFLGCSGSRVARSKSTMPSSMPVVRIQSFTADRM